MITDTRATSVPHVLTLVAICRVLASALALQALSLPAHSQEFFETRREFVVEKACEAYDGFKRRSNPVTLEPGKAYSGRGLNKRENASHVFIVVGTASKWVEIGCGRFADGAAPDASWASEGTTKSATDGRAGAPAPVAGGQTEAQRNACLPFFDTIDNPVAVKVGGKVDISPPAPALDAFDTAITATCGAPGKEVTRAEFKAMLGAHTAVAERIKAFTGGKVFGDRPVHDNLASYVDDLAEAWFAVKAFDHIMCGEPGAGRGKIGGLHFHARYLQLQQTGEACLMGNYSQNEVVPGVLYTTGVVMRLADGRVIRDARKGYGLTLGGEDLLKLVTRAFAENPTASGDSSACLLPVRDDGQAFTAVFVRRAAGIRTFYPDATPSPRDPKCVAPIALQ